MSHLLRSNHVGFTVRALARPIAMFETLFGYALVSRGGRDARGISALTGIADADVEVAHLRRDGFIGVELIAYRAPDGRGEAGGRPCDAGFTHLSFDAADIDAAVAAAAAFGLVPLGRIVGRRGGPGPRVVYLRDPDGIAIELVQPA